MARTAGSLHFFFTRVVLKVQMDFPGRRRISSGCKARQLQHSQKSASIPDFANSGLSLFPMIDTIDNANLPQN